MKGLEIGPAMGVVLSLQNSKGRIHLENILSDRSDPFPSPPVFRVAIQGCQAVTMNRVTVLGIEVKSATVAISGSKLIGRNGFYSMRLVYPSGPGLAAHGSRVTLSQCQVGGGRGYKGYNYVITPKSSVESTGSSIGILGDRKSVYSPGSLTGIPVPALSGDAASTLLLDPTVQLNPTGGAKGSQGFGRTTSQRIPCLSTGGTAPGIPILVDVYSPKGKFLVLLASLPRHPFAFPGLGECWLDPSFLMVLGAGQQGSTEHLLFTIPLPKDSRFHGLAPAFQGLSRGGGSFALTNPVVGLLH